MKKYLMIIESALVFVIGLSYYFEFTLIKSNSLKLYGFLSLILAIVLVCSQLTYMPLRISNRMAMISLIILLSLQIIPFVTWLNHANDMMINGGEKIEFVELTPPILISLASLGFLGYFLCLFIKTFKRRKKLKKKI